LVIIGCLLTVIIGCLLTLKSESQGHFGPRI